MQYVVTRAHQGDRWYDVGDTRIARQADVADLVERGVLVPASIEAKAIRRAPKNKAVKAAPANKAG